MEVKINIQLNKTGLVSFFNLIKRILFSLLILSGLSWLGVYLFKNFFSPWNVLRKKFEKLKNHPDQHHFIEQMHLILVKLVKLKYKLNLAGLPIDQIAKHISRGETAEKISALARKFEELKYTNSREISGEERQFLINNIKALF